METKTPQTQKTPKLSNSHIKYLTDKKKYFPVVYEKLNWHSEANKIVIDEHEGKKRFYHPHNKENGLSANSSDKGYSPRLLFNKVQDYVYFLEGETDYACCIENGITNVITGTGGCETFKKEWIQELKEKNIKTIYLCFDNDGPGKKTSKKHAELLAESGFEVFLLMWPEGFNDKEDIRDLIQNRKMSVNQLKEFITTNSIKIVSTAEPKKPEEEKSFKKEHCNGKFFETKKGWFANTAIKNKPTTLYLSSPFKILSYGRSTTQSDWATYIEFTDLDGSMHRMAMFHKDLYNKSALVEAVNSGLRVTTNAMGKDLLAELLMTAEISERARVTDSNGFQDESCYVTLNENIGICDQKYVYYSNSPYALLFKVQGTVSDWNNSVGKYISKNSNLVLGAGVVFVAPLLKLLGKENFGINFYGPSSQGKTTTLEVAASIIGSAERYPNGLVQSWRTTSNAAESIAKAHNDSTLFLDELGEAEPRAVSEATYFLGNGQGKSRATKTGDAKDRKSFKLTYLSTSEITVEDHLKAKNFQPRAGQTIRLLDVPTNVSEPYGAFESIHDFESSGKMVMHIKLYTKKYYGSAYKQYIEKISSEISTDRSKLKEKINSYIEAFKQRIAVKNKTSYHQRIIDNFSLVYAANLLALEYNCLALSENDNFQGTKACLDRVFAKIGTLHYEKTQIISTVKFFLEKHSENRFVTNDNTVLPNIDYAKTSKDRAGIVENVNSHSCYCFYPQVFKNEVIKGLDPSTVYAVLYSEGFLIKDTQGKNSVSIASFGRQMRVNAVRTQIMEWSEDDVLGVEGV